MSKLQTLEEQSESGVSVSDASECPGSVSKYAMLAQLQTEETTENQDKRCVDCTNRMTTQFCFNTNEYFPPSKSKEPPLAELPLLITADPKSPAAAATDGEYRSLSINYAHV